MNAIDVSAEIVADSIAPSGSRLTTFKLSYPRFVHAEFMTHRAVSRNASSSRAIPVARVLDELEARPVTPWHWGRNAAGMQAREALDAGTRRACTAVWRLAARAAAKASREMMEFGLHKQIANRVTEPFQRMSVVASATDWENFFALRCHPDAEPHIRDLAWAMADAYYVGSRPRAVVDGDWHLPFVDDDERAELGASTCVRLSVARCARVSYKNHDGSAPELERDLALYDRLVRDDGGPWEPGHMSPTEHQAQALSDMTASGNFRGWRQYRKTLPRENMTFDYEWARSHWRNS